VDALVNNAGEMLRPEQPFLNCSAEEMTHSFAVNTIAPMLLMQAVLPGMTERRWGAIVNVSSGQGAMNEMGPHHAAYRCSKVRQAITSQKRESAKMRLF
jgi:short-subunit dehydrogenase